MRFRAGHKRSVRGLTLTELAIVLGAAALILGGVWSVVSSVWNNYQNHRLREQVITIAENIRGYYMNAGRMNCVGGDITQVLDQDGRRLIPTEMRVDPDQANGRINHALASRVDGTLKVECLDNGGQFKIRLFDLKKTDCISLLLQFPVLMPEMGVKKIKTPGGGEKTINLLNIQTPAAGFPMTLRTASDWCSSNDKNEVSFDFKLRN